MANPVGRAFTKTVAQVQRVTPVAGGALRQILEIAIDGGGPLPSARAAAARQLKQAEGRHDDAVERIIRNHAALAAAQGFVTNLGGFAALPITLPANLAGVAIVQTRMIAAIAHLRGYDVTDDRVRTAVVMSMLGGEEIARRVHSGHLPTTPMAVATAPMFDPVLDHRVANEVLRDLAAGVGGKRVALTALKRIPLLGGGVGATYDAYMTHQLGVFARGEFRTRRALR